MWSSDCASSVYFFAQILKDDIGNIRPGGYVPAKCELIVRWMKKDEPPEFLEHRVNLKGVQLPEYFTICLDPG